MELHLTVGESELRSFDSMQLSRKNSFLPYFTKVINNQQLDSDYSDIIVHFRPSLSQSLFLFLQLPHDLSGNAGLNIFLWSMLGTGKDVICKVIVQARPDNTSNAGMKIREQVLAEKQHIKLVWHPKMFFEIQGIRSIKQGLADFAIHDLVLTASQQVNFSFVIRAFKFSTFIMMPNRRKIISTHKSTHAFVTSAIWDFLI